MNLPKWHVLTHVIESIKSFGTVDGTDTSTSEKLHTVWFKKWSHNTNFRGTWLDQLTRHLTIACKVQVQGDVLAHKGILEARNNPTSEDEITPFTTGITDAVRQIDDLRLKRMFSRSLFHAQSVHRSVLQRFQVPEGACVNQSEDCQPFMGILFIIPMK